MWLYVVTGEGYNLTGIKNMSAMQETLVQFLGQEDPLEKRKATHSSILDWRHTRI